MDTDSARRIPRHQHQPGEGLPARSPINLSDQLPRSYGVTLRSQARDQGGCMPGGKRLRPSGASRWRAWERTPLRPPRCCACVHLGTEGPPDLALASASAMAPWWYVPLGQFADAWLFEVPVPGCYYRVEVGLLGPGGAFVPVAASNVAQTPRASPCGLASRRPSAWSGSISRLA